MQTESTEVKAGEILASASSVFMLTSSENGPQPKEFESQILRLKSNPV